ncbi:hypothetical protein M3O96_04890 [Aquiflexum sp. TKW24L]|uniref:hypothetical protein n=1 Tax=Aquiflexum sp. TKW24L TaxID=2942212 RepID=UPI0020C118E2|nr:hypothetical protein [Aquiflexum sp. TKW24L]MCL6258412.1 hypothetical protein [Aquiflexum sp. TKW24L]
MENFKIRMKRKAFKNKVLNKDADSFIQPYKELPSDSKTGHGSDRINAHDLFSHYTADIIKENVMFTK